MFCRHPHIPLALAALLAAQPAFAAQEGPVEDAVPANIIFIVDSSRTMASCLSGDEYDIDADGTYETCASGSRLEAVQSAIKDTVRSMGEAWVAFAQTDPSDTFNGLGSIPTLNPVHPATRAGIMSPLRASRSEFRAAVDSVVLNTTYDAVTLAESLRDTIRYLNTGELHCNDLALCSASPIQYECQSLANYVILITDGTSTGINSLAADGSPAFDNYVPASPDINITNNPALDNVASFMAKGDLNIDLSDGVQRAYTYVVSLDTTALADIAMFNSVATNAGTAHYQVFNEAELRQALSDIYAEITDGEHEESPPVLSVFEDKLIVGYYEVDASRPLYNGQLLAWDLDDDPASPTYGQLLTGLRSPWNAGTALRDRSVVAGESRGTSDGNNGNGIRDIFTNIDLDATPDAFDSSNLSALCPLMLDTTAAAVTGGVQPGVIEGHDINGDGAVDTTDCQELINFVRGQALADFLGGGARGAWKLGSVRHSRPVIAEPRPLIFTRNPELRTFVNNLPQELSPCPTGLNTCEARVAFVAANDGMLHAFNVETGDELWAFIPRNILGRTVADTVEEGELRDLMMGETVLMDASPQVALVWIDGYQGAGVIGAADGKQTASEWVRVLLVGQGAGGRYYLALDITEPDNPYILWEDTAGRGGTATMGGTTARPQVGLVLDGSDDTWVAFYGSGQEVDGGVAEARLFIRAMGDLQGATERFTDTGIAVTVDLDGDGVHDGTGFPSDPAVIDRNNDGIVDEVYLVNSAGVMYKFIIDASDPDNSSGCLFFDPEHANLDSGATDVTKGLRTPSFYAPTAAVNGAGQVLVYWGTGSPYDIFTTDRGYFYVINSPAGCNEGELYTQCSFDGVVPLGLGERLMGAPVVYNSDVYFTTYAPNAADRCSAGEARLYGFDYVNCTATFDTNGSGVAGDGDSLYKTLGAGLPSEVLISNGNLYVATSNPSGLRPDLSVIAAPEDPFASTSSIQWRELF